MEVGFQGQSVPSRPERHLIVSGAFSLSMDELQGFFFFLVFFFSITWKLVRSP